MSRVGWMHDRDACRKMMQGGSARSTEQATPSPERPCGMSNELPVTCRICFSQEFSSTLPKGWMAARPRHGEWEDVRYGFCPECLAKRSLKPVSLPKTFSNPRYVNLERMQKHLRRRTLLSLLLTLVLTLGAGSVGWMLHAHLHPVETHAQ